MNGDRKYGEWVDESSGLVYWGEDVIIGYRGDAEELVLPEGVYEIGDGAFRGCNTLKSVVIPQGMERIGDAAFASCANLERVVLPARLRTLGINVKPWTLHDEGAFKDCVSLREIVLPVGVQTGDSLFEGCTSLSKAVYPAGTNLGRSAFNGCTSLKKFVVPAGVTRIQPLAFFRCTSLCEVVLPEGVETIGYMAFADCISLKRIDAPRALEVGVEAFSGCVSLCEVVLPDGAKIEEKAFADTPLEEHFEALRAEKERAYLAIKNRPRRRLSDEEVRALGAIRVEDNLLIAAVRYYSGYRGLGGSNPASDEITLVDETVPLGALAGREPYGGFGLYLRAAVDDVLYFTKGLGEDAAVVSFGEDGGYGEESGAYDTKVKYSITPVRK